tara:strand:- start:869 stop:2674 length:1806 start_codon:yes stop_codon:yes gene_type:complete
MDNKSDFIDNYEESDIATNENQNKKTLIRKLSKNFKLIFSFGSILSIFSIFYASNVKELWEGQLQIVLSENSSSTFQLPLSFNSGSTSAPKSFSSFFGGIGAGGKKLRTEVEILKSPSVLLPIYNYLMDSKEESDRDTFKLWREKYFAIKLLRNTSVLNIYLQDHDKDLILPALEKISDTYKAYSSRDTKKRLERGKSFLDDQIKVFKVKSSNSQREIQEFAMKYDLNYKFNVGSSGMSGVPASLAAINIDQVGLSSPLSSAGNYGGVDIEKTRVEASNRLRMIEEYLQIIESENFDIEEIVTFSQYVYETLGADFPKPVYEDIERLSQLMNLYETKFKNNDFKIKKIALELDISRDNLKTRTVNALKTLKSIDLAVKNAATRPKGVLIKYKELLVNANNDANTLNELRSQRRSIDFELAKGQVPWQLITNPTLLSYPVAPNKNKIIFLGVITSFVGLAALSLLKEKYLGFTFSDSDISQNINVKVLSHISLESENDLENTLANLSDRFSLKNKDNGVAFLLVGEFKEELIKILKEKVSQKFDKALVISNEEYFDENIFVNKFLISYVSVTKFSQLARVKNDLILKDNKPKGIIILDPYLS